MTEHRHPLSDDLYTPVTDELLSAMTRMKDEHDSWRRVAAISGTRLKVLRNIRCGKRKAISQRLWDRLVTTTGVSSIHEFPWFTAEDLVALGIWKAPRYVEANRRIQAGVTTVDENHGHKSTARREAEKIAKNKRKMDMLPKPNPFGIKKPPWLS